MNETTVADPVDVYLEHYGVKGMRWGVQRDQAIKESRLKTAERMISAERSTSKAAKKKAYDKILVSEDYMDNLSLTRGEAAVTAIFTLGLGNLTVAAIKGGAKLDAKRAQKRLDANNYEKKK